MRWIHGIAVRGLDVDGQSRCRHWHGAGDIVALRMKCCGLWMACISCHAALAGHRPAVWPLRERHVPAVLCGACGARLAIAEYLNAEAHARGAPRCPRCAAPFNPGCKRHWPLYFEMPHV